jgi:L-alanine-DL-glutamate epimerase-like enolase superfamily enzyme
MGAAAVEAYLHEWAAPKLLGQDPLAIEARNRDLTGYLGWRGSGVETRGNSAVDIALWDIFGKAANMPVHTALGGKSRDSIRIYNTCAGYQYIRSATNQTSSNWGLGNNNGPYEDLQGFLQPRRRAGRIAAVRRHHGDEDLALRPGGRKKPWPVHQPRRPGHRAGALSQDPQRGRRQDGHHG